MTKALRQFPLPGTPQNDCHDISLALWGDSKVILVGGSQNGSHLRLIRIFDLADGCWSSLPCRLQTARTNSTVLVVNDQLYVFGGAPSAPGSATYEIVDLTDNTVTELPMPMSWHHMKCVGYQGRKIFLLGGCDQHQATDECWCFDVKIGHFQRLTAMNIKRCLPAVGLYNDTLIVVGGLDEDLGKWQPSASTYDIPSDAWSELEDMPVVAEKILTSFIHDAGLFVVLSKDSRMSYDLLQHSWRAKAPSGLEELEVDCRVVLQVPQKSLLVWTTPTKLMTLLTENVTSMVAPTERVVDEPRRGNFSRIYNNALQNETRGQRTGPNFKDQATNLTEIPMAVATFVATETPQQTSILRNERRNNASPPYAHNQEGQYETSVNNGNIRNQEPDHRFQGESSHGRPDPIFRPSGRTEPLTASMHHTTQICEDGSMLPVGSLSVDSIHDPSRVFQMQQGKPFFFIAHYGNESKEEIARPTYWFLTKYLKVDVFMDDAELEVGGDQRLLLLRPAYECTHALVILSPSFRSSKACVRELNSFMDRWHRRDGIKIIPALWKTNDVQGYCDELDNIVWLRCKAQSMDAADYMVSTLWPRILTVLPEQYRQVYTTFQMERLLAAYVRRHRTVVSIPMSLERLAARYRCHPRSHCCIS